MAQKNGDNVKWYNPMFCGKIDTVYMSKVFIFTDDYPFPVYYEIQHIFPDYSLYPDLTKNTAYGLSLFS